MSTLITFLSKGILEKEKVWRKGNVMEETGIREKSGEPIERSDECRHTISADTLVKKYLEKKLKKCIISFVLRNF